MQCVNLTDEELWRAIAQNTNAMSALVYRRIELDAGNARDDVIDRAQLMQSLSWSANIGNSLTSFAAAIPLLT
jgi:hypothetical protein